MNHVKECNTLILNHTSVNEVQYNMFSLFRILRPIRIKYKLTINEIIFLIGALIYHKFVSSLFSASSLRKYVGYFNMNKFNYYLGVLIVKGCIVKNDIIQGTARYKLTELGLSILVQLDDDYNRALYKFCSDHNVEIKNTEQ